jgi:hypothetical protein
MRALCFLSIMFCLCLVQGCPLSLFFFFFFFFFNSNVGGTSRKQHQCGIMDIPYYLRHRLGIPSLKRKITLLPRLFVCGIYAATCIHTYIPHTYTTPHHTTPHREHTHCSGISSLGGWLKTAGDIFKSIPLHTRLLLRPYGWGRLAGF